MMLFILLLLTFIPSATITWFIIPYIVRWSESHLRQDQPNERKIHKIPISRLGGSCFFPIMIFITTMIVYVITPLGIEMEGGERFGLTISSRMATVVFSSLILYIVGIIDDLYGVNYILKLLAQTISAVIIGYNLCLPIFGLTYHFFFAIFFIVYVLNAMNFIDGIDGLASGLGIISLSVLALIHAILGNWFGAILATSLIGVLVAFFYYNVFSWEHKIFMGDSGSLTIGLIISYLIISTAVFERRIEGSETFYFPIALATIAVPMLDVIRVVVNRLLNRKNPFKPDKTHVHHRLMNKGYTASQTLRFLLFHTVVVTALVFFIVVFINNLF